MIKKKEKGRRKKTEDNQSRFISLLKKYVGIKTIEIVITLKSGKILILKRERDMTESGAIIFNDGTGRRQILLSDIEKAELFAA